MAFPLVTGIIALAIGFEGVFHPGDYTTTQVAISVGVGLTLFLGATAGALWRAVQCVLWNRLIVLVVTLGALGFLASSHMAILGIAAAGLATIVVIEQVTVSRHWP